MATILLVDDVEIFIELEKSFLLEVGHQILTATSGEEALEQLDVVRPDLVLLDLYMPGINGDEVCRHIRAAASTQDMPVLMVTSAGKEEDLRRCLEAGCDDYITKPINKQLLLEKVNRLLAKEDTAVSQRGAVKLRVHCDEQGADIAARARRILTAGVNVNSERSLDLGSVVVLVLEFADGETLELSAKVARVGATSDAAEHAYFVHPSGAGRQKLNRFICQHERANGSARASEEDAEMFPLDADALRQRVQELEEENRHFAEQLVTIEDINNNLTNLYIASTKLHSVVRRNEVISIIKEVVINFVGSEKFALLLKDKTGAGLDYVAGEGLTAEDFNGIDQSLLMDVLDKGESYYAEDGVAAGSDNPAAPLAAIPIAIRDKNIGVLAIYRLFVQKEAFQTIDYQLFTMMAEHAASALFISSIYEESERKRETYKGFMDLLLHD